MNNVKRVEWITLKHSFRVFAIFFLSFRQMFSYQISFAFMFGDNLK